MRETTAAFTGHRPQHLGLGDDENAGGILRIKSRLEAAAEAAVERGFVRFISGMSLGVDIWAAEAVLRLRERLPQVALECAVPCAGQSDRWSETDRRRYRDILERADRVTVLAGHYDPGCMHRRNRYMVDHAGLLIAVYIGKPGGGTAQTVAYALRQGVKIENVI